MKKAIVDPTWNPIAIHVTILNVLETPRDPRRRKKRRIEHLMSPVVKTKRISMVRMSFL